MNDYFFPFSETPILTPQLTGGRECECINCRQEITMPLKDDLVPKRSQKNCLTSLLKSLKNNYFSTIFRQLLFLAAVADMSSES